MDKYSSFENLSAHEARGADYEVRWRLGSSGIAIFSIHGGEIEPGTSEIADAIAGDDHTFYTLRGTKTALNRELHITSTIFDEPVALEIVCQSEIIISIHGCSDKDEVVYTGGLDTLLREGIRDKLVQAGFKVIENQRQDLRGEDQRNICNLCGRGMGVQLEISRGLRTRMFGNLSHRKDIPSRTFFEFVRAVREAVEPFKLPATGTEYH